MHVWKIASNILTIYNNSMLYQRSYEETEPICFLQQIQITGGIQGKWTQKCHLFSISKNYSTIILVLEHSFRGDATNKQRKSKKNVYVAMIDGNYYWAASSYEILALISYSAMYYWWYIKCSLFVY